VTTPFVMVVTTFVMVVTTLSPVGFPPVGGFPAINLAIGSTCCGAPCAPPAPPTAMEMVVRTTRTTRLGNLCCATVPHSAPHHINVIDFVAGMPFLGGAVAGLHYLVLLIIRVRAAVWDAGGRLQSLVFGGWVFPPVSLGSQRVVTYSCVGLCSDLDLSPAAPPCPGAAITTFPLLRT